MNKINSKVKKVLNYSDMLRIRMRVGGIILFLIAIALGVRFYFVQVRQHDFYYKEARRRYVAVKKITGKRGEIYDVNGYLLVGNAPCVRFSCSPFEIKDPLKRRKLAHIFKNFFGNDLKYYEERLTLNRPRLDKYGEPMRDKNGKILERPNKYFIVERELDIQKAEELKEILRVNKFPVGAFSYEPAYKRTYPKGNFLANVLGYTNMDGDDIVPQSGLERQLAKDIRPETGKVRYERARDGSPLGSGVQHLAESRDGKNIYLTISEPIQGILEEELRATYNEFTPDAVYGAIADPKTGNILALAQCPTFDPNDRSTYSGDGQNMRTRIADDAFEPGSIAKPFTIGKALDWGFVTPNTVIDCDHGHWYYLGKPMSDSHPYDKLTISQVIQKSSNIGTAKVALMLGEEKVCQALQMFGFGTKTGLPFPSESAGSKPKPNPRDKLAVTRMPIGYSMSVTPLQLIRAYCALANNGFMPKLRLIDRIEDPDTGKVTVTPVAEPVPLFEHSWAHKQLIDMMITVTQEGGTAKKAAVPGYTVAGKTGTSRKYVPGHGYMPHQYYGSFVGFVPARNPKLVIAITLDNPKKASYGGVVAGPTFSRTALRVLQYWNIPPDNPEPEKSKK